jgi:hypothetical protein
VGAPKNLIVLVIEAVRIPDGVRIKLSLGAHNRRRHHNCIKLKNTKEDDKKERQNARICDLG